jgi:hypothetical protein
MRMIVHIDFPIEPFNTLARKGMIGQTIQKILAAVKPEAIYFSEQDGHRGAVMVVQVKEASEIPGIAEPFFLSLNAECKFRIAMTPEDLAKSGLDKLAKEF